MSGKGVSEQQISKPLAIGSFISHVGADDPPVTVEVLRLPRAGRELDFEQYLTGVCRAAMVHQGHLGTNIFRPAKGSGQAYRIIFKFDRRSNLIRWESSEERAEWRRLAEIVSTISGREVISGLEAWFTLPEQSKQHPSKHKVTAIVWLGIYLLVNLTSVVIGPLVETQPLLIRTFSITIIVVPVMTYLLLPFLTRLFSRWL